MFGADSLQPPYSITVDSHEDTSNDSSFSSRGMLDHSRLLMCFFMGVFVVCNPVSFAMKAGLQRMGGQEEGEAYTGRSILADNVASEGKSDLNCVLWFLSTAFYNLRLFCVSKNIKKIPLFLKIYPISSTRLLFFFFWYIMQNVFC